MHGYASRPYDPNHGTPLEVRSTIIGKCYRYTPAPGIPLTCRRRGERPVIQRSSNASGAPGHGPMSPCSPAKLPGSLQLRSPVR
jgi:hypothetical protein